MVSCKDKEALLAGAWWQRLIGRLLKHKPTGIITGFRSMDGAVITWCAHCETPIVSGVFRASGRLLKTVDDAMWREIYGEATDA